MTKTSSPRIKANNGSNGNAKNQVLLSIGVVSIIIAIVLFLLWILVPTFFALYIVPLLVIFIPIVFFITVVFSMYNAKKK